MRATFLVVLLLTSVGAQTACAPEAGAIHGKKARGTGGTDDGGDSPRGGDGEDRPGGSVPSGNIPPGGTANDGTTTIGGTAPIAVVPVRRLNRAEYNNTIRDLLGDTTKPALAFPEDALRGGFSNNAEALTLSPIQVELYVSSAEKLVAKAMGSSKRATIVLCDPKAAAGAEGCARASLNGFATRAYRRPASPEDTDALVALFRSSQAAGDSFDEAMGVALRAVLVSPSFLFRIEDAGGKETQGAPVDAYAMASRLSYFLWSSMPDEALFKAAESGQLATKEQIDAQAGRMLADPKSQALIDNFVGEWILGQMSEAAPAKESFPKFDDALKASMIGETKAFLASFLFEPRNFKETMTTRETFVDARLADYYGIEAPASSGFARVTLPASSHRIGLLTQGSVLTMTSVATRGSPTRRGAWILDSLMCAPPASPQPNTPELPAQDTTGATLRQKLEEHRKNPACAGCHSRTDPLGLSLEHFDGIGGYREEDNGAPIDSSGILPDGRKISGSEDLAAILAGDPRLTTCAATKLYAYARGKEVSLNDTVTSAAVGKVFADSGYRMKDFARTLVNDVSFRNRAR
jgi:hypothetical protein